MTKLFCIGRWIAGMVSWTLLLCFLTLSLTLSPLMAIVGLVFDEDGR